MYQLSQKVINFIITVSWYLINDRDIAISCIYHHPSSRVLTDDTYYISKDDTILYKSELPQIFKKVNISYNPPYIELSKCMDKTIDDLNFIKDEKLYNAVHRINNSYIAYKKINAYEILIIIILLLVILIFAYEILVLIKCFL